MTYTGILAFTSQPPCPPPGCFSDLRLDHILAAIAKEDHTPVTAPVFYQPPTLLSTVMNRQAVMKELEDPKLRDIFQTFCDSMRQYERCIGCADAVQQRDARVKWRLDGASLCCDAIARLKDALAGRPLVSEGLRSFRLWLTDYCATEAFLRYASETRSTLQALETIRFITHVEQKCLRLSADTGDENFCTTLQASLEPLADMPDAGEILFFGDPQPNRLEERQLDLLRSWMPEPFRHLHAWNDRFPVLLDPALERFDQEIRFYLAFHRFLDTLRHKNLPFCYPVFADTGTLRLTGFYDLALALTEAEVVTNDCLLAQDERLMVLTGPNQGGKTTFARALGQVFWLASLGCPVPCREADLFLCDVILTHFSVQESSANPSGRLQEELVRMHHLFEQATDRSLVLLNELFSTTTTQDALHMGQKVLARLAATGCCGLYVTHLPELAAMDGVVSLVAGVQPESEGLRTYRIHRRPADGLAHAATIAARYGLDRQRVLSRLRQPIRKEHATTEGGNPA